MAKTNQEERRKAPILRFKGFTNDWEQRMLKEISKRVLRKNTDLISNRPLTISAQLGLVDQVDFFNKQVASSNLKNYILLKKGEFAYNKSYSKGYPFGTIKRLDLYENGAVSTLYIAFSVIKNVNSDYLIQLFSTNKWHKQVYMVAAEGARNHGLLNISSDDFFKISLGISTSKSEQYKIAELLNKISKLIALYERKNKLLSQMKKYFLDNLFAENKYPNLRFKGFTNAWEQKKLGNYIIQYKEKTIINNQYPVLTSSRNGIFLQKDYYNGRNVASKNNIGYSIVPRNYFTYRNMSDDLKFKFNINTIVDKGIVSPIYPVFTTKNNLNSIFLKYKLNYGKEFKKFAIIQKQGGTRTSLNYSKLEEFYINMPCYCEQKIIAKTINKFENLITLNKDKLKQIKQIKKELLDTMFI